MKATRYDVLPSIPLSNSNMSLCLTQEVKVGDGINMVALPADVLESADILNTVLGFVGPGVYRYVGAVNRTFRQTYKDIHKHKSHLTEAEKAVASVARATIYLQEKGPKQWVCRLAAKSGELKVLQLARANGCPWDEFTCHSAASCGHLEILQWARANGCPWDKLTCSIAARCGHFENLQWARTNGCPWDECTCALAACEGHLDILQWARTNGCPWNSQRCLEAARFFEHVDVLQWIEENS